MLLITLTGGSEEAVSKLVYWICPVMLFSLAVLSLLTSAKASFIVFKLSPVIFTISG